MFATLHLTRRSALVVFAIVGVGACSDATGSAGHHPLTVSLTTQSQGAVADITVRDNDLVIATHGRSFYVMDDVAPLRQMASTALPPTPRLFRPSDAVRRCIDITGLSHLVTIADE